MDITPFRGYRYDPKTVGDPGLCIAPPYDVIDAEQQDHLYRQSPFNIVRITLNKKEPGDNETRNVYTRAAEHLKDYLAKGALKPDPQPAIYVYVQDFRIGDKTYRRSGFIALGKLEGYGGSVKPHEQTLAGPKADRLNLMRATKTQTGQIFMLYSDPAGEIDQILAKASKGKELLSRTDEDGVSHKLFSITDPAQIATVQKVMQGKQVFIADGHHRYETANNYFNETKNPAAASHLMTFVNTHNEGLIVLPTHRLIHDVANFDPGRLLMQMGEHFDIAQMSYGDMLEKKQKREMMHDAMAVEFEAGQHAFGMYFNDGSFYVATLRNLKIMAQVASQMSEPWRSLDVAILHKLILEKMLGIDEAALREEKNVHYIKDFGSATLRALDQVDEGAAQGLFFLNPTRAAQVEAVAAQGEKMPQKSTFFFPKMFSGLVINVLD